MTTRDQQATLREAYDEVEYNSGLIDRTHPCQIGGIASLFGVYAPPVAKARILEIGCGLGQNIIPIAASLPEAICVGVDLSSRQIERAQRNAESLRLDNLILIASDVRELVGELDNFDYIICHGVYSWVPDEVRADLFNVCRRLLSPSGLLYISYNVFPGWADFGLMRGLFLRLFPQQSWSREKNERIDAWIRALPEGPTRERYEKLWFKQFRALPDFYKRHGIFSEINQPYYFTEVVDHAERSGFRYLSDMNLKLDLPTHSLRGLIEQNTHLPRLDQIQLLDLAQHISFRASVFRRATRGDLDAESGASSRVSKLDDLQLASISRLSVLSLFVEVDPTPEQEKAALKTYPHLDVSTEIKYYQRRNSPSDELTPLQPSLSRELIDAAAESWPRPLPLQHYFSQLSARSPDALQELLPQLVKSLIYKDLDILVDPPSPLIAPTPLESPDFCPQLSSYNAYYIQQGESHLTMTHLHRHPDAARSDPWFLFADHWDGTRTRPLILESVQSHPRFAGSQLAKMTDEERATTLEASLALFWRDGLI